MDNFRKGLLIVLSGPSGVGKGSILKRIIGRRKSLKLSISYTTRAPRKGEINGKDYHFVTKEEFMEIVDRGEMLEYACYCGNYYGTPYSEVEKELNSGNNVILEIEVQGGEQILKKCPKAISVFVIPPSTQDLCSRLTGRALDSQDTVSKRVQEAKREIAFAKNYSYVVVNDSIDDCAGNILKIIDAESLKFPYMQNIVEGVLKNG